LHLVSAGVSTFQANPLHEAAERAGIIGANPLTDSIQDPRN
jgi:hypothetical protein